MLKPRTDVNAKIIIRGKEHDKSKFKPVIFYESEIKGILESLTDYQEVAATRRFKDSEYVPSLLYLEGLVRYQFEKLFDEHELYPEELETTSDFQQLRGFIGEYTDNVKVIFLFDFLSDIVYYSNSPELMDESALKNIAQNIRSLSFLMESQVTGGLKADDIAFKAFAYAVWKYGEAGSRKITANQFWNKAIKILNDPKHEKEITFPLNTRKIDGKYRTDNYGIRLEIKKTGKEVLKPFCESKDIPKEKAKSLTQIQKIWKGLQKEFISRSK